jgi:uncharacterized protein (DUF1810 family)
MLVARREVCWNETDDRKVISCLASLYETASDNNKIICRKVERDL